MNKKETIWKLEPHTKAKHIILDKYLKAWFPIMSAYNNRLLYIDGFAGPGVYKDGEDGSPVIAIDIAKNHIRNLKAEIVFIFIELDSERCENLERILSTKEYPDNYRIEVYCSTFENILSTILGFIKEESHLAPSFVFIDPFGYSQTPFFVVKRIMSHPKCEVLITFMYDCINRFILDPTKEECLNEHFGTDKWKEIEHIEDAIQRKQFIYKLYVSQLKEEVGINFVRSFEMINKNGHTEYFLIFGTNHVKGLEQMKNVMWRVDPTGEYRFSDRTDPNQPVLFEIEPNYHQLKRLVVQKFNNSEVRIEDIENFVVEETAFIVKHLRKPILKEMENSSPPKIKVTERKRRNTYPPGCKIMFMN